MLLLLLPGGRHAAPWRFLAGNACAPHDVLARDCLLAAACNWLPS
jgi:hypothetical protein